MNNLFRHPYLVFAVSLLAMLLAAQVGASFCKRRSSLDEGARQDLDVITAATLTLLGLIIGFSFSMALSRYDQRKNYEEALVPSIASFFIADVDTPRRGVIRGHPQNLISLAQSLHGQ